MRSQRSKHNSGHDRRLNWRERRSSNERRNPVRVQHMPEDCRRGVPRRESDVSGSTNEVDVWWELEYPVA